MSGPMDVDAESLEGSGKALVGVSEQFAEALTGFQAELEGFGEPWGADDIGSLIGIAYGEVAAFAFECYGDALDEIAAAGEDLSGMAASYTEAEEAINEMVTNLEGLVK